MSLEKRRSKRSGIFLVVEFRPYRQDVKYSLGMTSNFSHYGFCFESQMHNFSAGERIEFKLKHLQSGLSVSGAGEVVWKNEHKFECLTGISIKDMDISDRQKVLSIIPVDNDIPVESITRTINTENGSFEQETVGPEPEAITLNDQPESRSVIDDRTVHHNISPTPTLSADTSSVEYPATPRVKRAEPSHINAKERILRRQKPTKKTEKVHDHDKPSKTEQTTAFISRASNKRRLIFAGVVLLAAVTLAFAIKIMYERNRTKITNLIPSSESLSAAFQEAKNTFLSSEEDAPTGADGLEKIDEDLSSETISNNTANERPSPHSDTDGEDQLNAMPPQEDISNDLPEADQAGIPRGHLIIPLRNESEQELPSKENTLHEEENVSSTNSAALEAEHAPSDNIIHKKSIKEKISGAALNNVTTPESKPQLALVIPGYTGVEQRKKLSAAIQLSPALYDEPFDDDSGIWDIIDTGTLKATIINGGYQIENNSGYGSLIVLNAMEYPVESNYIIEAVLRSDADSDNHSYGIVIGAKDSRNNHVFQINKNTFYSISKYQKGYAKELIRGKMRTGIIDADAANTLKIIKAGNTVSFFINDTYVFEVLNLSFFGNKTGFMAGQKTKITVDWMRSRI